MQRRAHAAFARKQRAHQRHDRHRSGRQEQLPRNTTGRRQASESHPENGRTSSAVIAAAPVIKPASDRLPPIVITYTGSVASSICWPRLVKKLALVANAKSRENTRSGSPPLLTYRC